MPRNGLNKERVIEAAAQFIDQFGTADFSMKALADSLNIKTASLYNHVESMDSLFADVCVYALRMQYDTELSAIQGKSGNDAIFALAKAHRQFAKAHRELYRLIMNKAVSCEDRLHDICDCIVEPFLKVLDGRCLSDEERTHWQRVLRGIVHGFVAQEDAGFFAHMDANIEDSFHTAIQCYIDGLTQAETRK